MAAGRRGARCAAVAGFFSGTGWLSQADADYRRAVNERGADSDTTGWLTVAAVQLVLLLGKTVLQERKPVLALVNSSHALLALALAWLTTHRRQAYVACREWLLAVASLHLSFVTLNGAINGGTNIITAHGGSPLRLLLLLLLATPTLLLGIYALYARPLLAWSRTALPLLAAAPLLAGHAMCARVLQAPAVEAPLSSLYHAVSLLHSVTAQHTAHPEPSGPAAQCIATNAWASLAFGAVLPLFVLGRLGRLERSARRQFDACWQQRQEREREQRQERDGEQASGSEARQEPWQASREQGPTYNSTLPPPLMPPAWWAYLELYLQSCLAFAAARILASVA